MRQSEPALHEPGEPVEVVAEDQKVMVVVPSPTLPTLPNMRTAKARPAIAAVAGAKAGR
jgi:hypothetical protein